MRRYAVSIELDVYADTLAEARAVADVLALECTRQTREPAIGVAAPYSAPEPPVSPWATHTEVRTPHAAGLPEIRYSRGVEL